MKKYHRINYTERLLLEKHYNSGKSVRYIASALDRPVQTIYRELKNGYYEHLNSDYTISKFYSSDLAQQRADHLASSHGRPIKLGRDFAFAEYVEDKIKSGWSPDVIVGRLKYAGNPFQTSVCTSTLYSYIHKGVFLNITDNDLLRSRKQSKQTSHRAKRAPAGSSIEKRPQSINDRSSFGHWEMDTVVGDGKKGEVLLVLTERLTRHELMRKMPDKSTHSTIEALRCIKRQFGRSFFHVFKSITVDNGSEFSSDIYKNARSPLKGRVPVYYCHPYSSYERASNENQNILIRRFIPKGDRLEKHSSHQIATYQHAINQLPRKILGYMTAQEAFTEQLAVMQLSASVGV